MVDSREEVFPITKESIDNEDEDFVSSFKTFRKQRFFSPKAARCIRADMLEIAVPKNGDVVSGKRTIKKAAKDVG